MERKLSENQNYWHYVQDQVNIQYTLSQKNPVKTATVWEFQRTQTKRRNTYVYYSINIS